MATNVDARQGGVWGLKAVEPALALADPVTQLQKAPVDSVTHMAIHLVTGWDSWFSRPKKVAF